MCILLCATTRTQSQFSEFLKQLTMVPIFLAFSILPRLAFATNISLKWKMTYGLTLFWKTYSKFSQSVQSLSRVWLFVTPWIAACQASLSITNSRSLLKLMFIELAMPSNYLILCRPLLLSSIFPSIRVFSNESALHIKWPKYWSFSFNISPSSEYTKKIFMTQIIMMMWSLI